MQFDMELKNAFYATFTDDPVNWIKWGVVFAILIVGYIIAIPLYKKVSYRLSWERKRDIARTRNHIIQADIVKQRPSGHVGGYDWHATYRYFIEGEEHKYRAFFKHPGTPPRILYLYYIDNPKRVFSYDEYHWESHKGIILLPIILLPWILAIAAIFLLRIPISP